MGNIKIMPKVRRACVRWSAQIISDVRGPDCGGELRGGNEGSVHDPLTRAPLSSGLSQKQRAGAFAPALIRASQSICCGSVLPRINPLPPWIRAIAGHPKARAKRRCGSGTLRVMPPAISRAAARSAAGGGTTSLKSGLWALAWIRTFRARWIVAQTPGRPGRSYQGKRRSGGGAAATGDRGSVISRRVHADGRPELSPGGDSPPPSSSHWIECNGWHMKTTGTSWRRVNGSPPRWLGSQ
jgi:hypothetical protein